MCRFQLWSCSAPKAILAVPFLSGRNRFSIQREAVRQSGGFGHRRQAVGKPAQKRIERELCRHTFGGAAAVGGFDRDAGDHSARTRLVNGNIHWADPRSSSFQLVFYRSGVLLGQLVSIGEPPRADRLAGRFFNPNRPSCFVDAAAQRVGP